MGFYQNYCLPYLINAACGLKIVQSQRRKIIPLAEGRVLEVGMGSGLNIPFYRPDKVEMLWGLEPSAAMRKLAHANVECAEFELSCLDFPGEQIPLDNDSVDTVVLTYTLCTIADWSAALQEMRRVLRPGGRLLFCEHGLAPDTQVRLWQERLSPYWQKLAGGCHLDRPIPDYLMQAGFDVDLIERGYLPAAPKIVGFQFLGIAK